MSSLSTSISRLRRIGPALVLMSSLGATGCDDTEPTGPGFGDVPAFSEEITLQEFEDVLTAGPVRVEIELLSGGLTAREVELERPEDLADREEIESRITAITSPNGSGTLTLELGGLVIGFDSGTEFRDDDGDLTAAGFVDRVDAALAAGRFPAVEVKREPPTEPQAPDDPTFLATRIELEDDDEVEEPKIEMNLDADNFEPNPDPAAGEPDAWVRALGLRIEIRSSEGVTELEAEREEAEGEIEFEGIVDAVDTGAREVTLTDGTVLRLVTGSEIEDDGEDGERLTTLAELASALQAARIVEAEGEGVLESEGPRTLVVIEVEFELEDDDSDDGPDDDSDD